MAKRTINPKAIKSALQSFKDYPLSAKEIMEIEEIQAQQYWKRKPLKEQFCDRNNRMVSEVDEYFKKNQRVPDGTQRKNPDISQIKDTSGSIVAPKEQVTEVSQLSTSKLFPTGEIRIKYKSLRIDDGHIIFEV